jgi:thiol-disulfide isomerase/thioredoxin
MIILHINSKSNNAHLFNKYVEEGKQIFVIFYMEGCGPCNATRPEWKKIENVMANLKNDNVVIVDLDQEVLEEIENLQSKPVGYPTIRYISNKGKMSEDYNGERNIDAFVSWIKSKIINSKITNSKITNSKITKDNKFYGKKNRKTRKTRKSRKSRKSRKNKINY